MNLILGRWIAFESTWTNVNVAFVQSPITTDQYQMTSSDRTPTTNFPRHTHTSRVKRTPPTTSRTLPTLPPLTLLPYPNNNLKETLMPHNRPTPPYPVWAPTPTPTLHLRSNKGGIRPRGLISSMGSKMGMIR